MIEFYPQIKLVHIVAVMISGSLFLIRGVLLQVGQGWVMAAPPRYLSYVIDSVLLTTAIMLLTVLPLAAYGNGWLAVKVSLLVVYVGLGSFALKRGRTQRARLGFFIAALLAFGSMYAIARTHDPLGPLKLLGAWLT